MKKMGKIFSWTTNKNAYAIAVTIALVVASSLLVAYYVTVQPASDEYTNIYLLDSNRKAADYPEFVVANVNSTFHVYVDVENHLNYTLSNFQVQVKIANDTNPAFPLQANATQTFTGTIQKGATWETPVTVSLDQPGNYLVSFELWILRGGALQFSGDFCVLNVQVAAETV
jgi:uncharacterized membrane protein